MDFMFVSSTNVYVSKYEWLFLWRVWWFHHNKKKIVLHNSTHMGIELQKLHLNELKQSSHNLHEWNKNIRNCSIMVFQMLEFFKTFLPIFPPKHTNCTISYALRSSNHMTCDIIIPIMGSNIQNILVFYERK